jgi:N-acetylmuramate 1-kinase
MNERSDLARAFLAQHGWALAESRAIAGDASDRSYRRLSQNGQSAILMDSPPGKGDDPRDFVAIAGHLTSINLSPPEIYAQDLTKGFLLLEDLGDGLFARLVEADPSQEMALYAAATDVLVYLQTQPAPAGLPDLSAQDWAQAAGFALDWYAFAATGERPDSAAFQQVLSNLLQSHADGPRVMILRDYHAENLLHLPGRSGLQSVGLLDFQLAQMGQPCYDLMSLLQDARRDVSPEVASAMIARFAKATGTADLGAACAVIGAQRALRIIGIFARLCLVAGKPGYLDLIPRVWGHLQQNLAHPALVDLRRICDALLPEPDPEVLKRIKAQCLTPCP